MGNSVTSVARFGRKSRAGELADGSGSGQRALPAAQRPQECSISQSSCSSYNACDSDGLPDRMRHPSDSLDHAAGTPESPAFACSSVKGLRREMEDEHIAARPLLCQNGLPAANLFGVFDGHGGRKCAQYLHKHLAPAVRGSLLQMNDGGSRSAAIENALKSAFCEVDSAFLSTIGREEVGSTAIVVLQEGKTLYCANTGDSRAILCRADGPTPLSSDHKPSRPDEKQRIEDAGGFVVYNRVMGRLGVSRAFGDKSLKPLVVADPDVLTVTLEDGDDFVVLACDGLWDVAGIDTVAELVHTHSKDKGLEGVAQALTTYAVRNGSHDNVTCMVVDIRSVLEPGPTTMRTGGTTLV